MQLGKLAVSEDFHNDKYKTDQSQPFADQSVAFVEQNRTGPPEKEKGPEVGASEPIQNTKCEQHEHYHQKARFAIVDRFGLIVTIVTGADRARLLIGEASR